MELVRKVTWQRDIRGYAEVTEVNVWVTWRRGCQVFIVHQIRNGQETIEDVLKAGEWFLTEQGLCNYMERLKLSFMNDVTMDFSDLLEFKDIHLEDSIGDHHVDGSDWRILVREEDIKIKRTQNVGNIKIYHSGAFAVAVDRRSAINQPPFLCPTSSTDTPEIFKSLDMARVVALGLAAINYNSEWARSMKAMFHKPHVVIEQKKEAGWVPVEIYQILDLNYELVFNKECTAVCAKPIGAM